MNIQSDIHTSDYRKDFLDRRISAESLIAPMGRSTESLDGGWHFTVDALEYILRGRWYTGASLNADGSVRPADYDFEASEMMPVPSCWNMQRPELFHYNGTGIYERRFRYAPEKEGERLFLCFEGVSYRAYIFLNGEYLGFHDGASTPFSVDITESVREDNTLIVAADAARSENRIPTVNTDWFNYGGVYRSVYLLRMPEAFIRSMSIYLEPSSRIAFEVAADGPDGEVTVSIPELGIMHTAELSGGKCRGYINADPELWSPENPKLYEVSVRYRDDEVHERIGFRIFSTDGDSILLNGEKRILRGICIHEDHPVLGKTADDESIRETIRLVKEDLHCDFIRLTHYPHSRRFSEIADEMGIMLWEEIPVYWAVGFSDPAVYADAENQLSELIIRDRNRASVVIWSVGNENPDTDERLSFMTRLAAAARHLDPSRPVSAACLIDEEREIINDRLADALDIIGINEYYGWYSFSADKLVRVMHNSHPGKPVILTETGAGAEAGFHGAPDQLWTEEKQADYYVRQTEAFRKAEGLSGYTPWVLYDFRSERRANSHQRGYNRKGLIAEDRKTRKAAFSVLAGFYKEIKR